MDLKAIAGYLPALASLLSSGPWGIFGVLGALGLLGGAAIYLLKKGNDARDASDLEKGGADAGRTSTDLRNQTDQNRKYLDQEEAIIKAEGEPKP